MHNPGGTRAVQGAELGGWCYPIFGLMMVMTSSRMHPCGAAGVQEGSRESIRGCRAMRWGFFKAGGK
jgi:hypothetical protein